MNTALCSGQSREHDRKRGNEHTREGQGQRRRSTWTVEEGLRVKQGRLFNG